jgi:hypothetical protein
MNLGLAPIPATPFNPDQKMVKAYEPPVKGQRRPKAQTNLSRAEIAARASAISIAKRKTIREANKQMLIDLCDRARSISELMKLTGFSKTYVQNLMREAKEDKIVRRSKVATIVFYYEKI